MKDHEVSLLRDIMLPEVHREEEMALNFIKAEKTSGIYRKTERQKNI